MELEPRVAILQDLRLQTFDSIRFASYRTASKLRYIQKSTNLHLVDIWNVIEAFRENGLNTLEPQSEVSVARLETLVSSLYHNLNKRLPTAQQVPVDSKAGLLLNSFSRQRAAGKRKRHLNENACLNWPARDLDDERTWQAGWDICWHCETEMETRSTQKSSLIIFV